MKRRILRIAIILVIILATVSLFLPKKILTNKENVQVTSVYYNGIKRSIDNTEELINILDKYKGTKTLETMTPYQNKDVNIEININDNHKPKHLLLGKFNIWYESKEKMNYNIVDGEKLKKELGILFEQNISE